MNTLAAQDVTLKYESGRVITENLSVTFEAGKIYSIIGPNGCGKSTLLRALSKQLKPTAGKVLMKGKELNRIPQKEAARMLSYLAQFQEPVDVKVRSLVSYGRSPYHSFMNRVHEQDEQIVQWALRATSLEPLAERNVMSLSGGERQRVWIAMSLAQQPEFMLLDEPTTYLDVCHQMEVLELSRKLNRDYRMTVVMVLHDMNHACQFSDEVIVMHAGKIVAMGAPVQVMTEELLKEVFGVRAIITLDDETGCPLCWIKGRDITA